MKRVLATAFIIVGFIGSSISGNHPNTEKKVSHKAIAWDDASPGDWRKSLKKIAIASSSDKKIQRAFYFKAIGEDKRPLLVSLHTWSGDYRQKDPLAEFAVKNNWNYLHPDFRGPNCTKDACLSEKAVKDIDDAIQYAITGGNVDKSNIFIVGVSGGAYATIGYFLKGKYTAKAYMAWAPITDLVSWYWQSKNRKSKYAQDILKCTSSSNGALDVKEAKKRSPIYWKVTRRDNSILEIYAGINDGYTGSVPISHSILFFNRLVNVYGLKEMRVPESDIVKLLTKSIENIPKLGKIGNRKVLYVKNTPAISLVIFDGTHEMLPEYCFERIKKIAEQ